MMSKKYKRMMGKSSTVPRRLATRSKNTIMKFAGMNHPSSDWRLRYRNSNVNTTFWRNGCLLCGKKAAPPQDRKKKGKGERKGVKTRHGSRNERTGIDEQTPNE
jgi:hypothetical protein